MSRFSFQFFSPILLFFLMLIDGQLTQLMTTMTGGVYTPVSHLMLIFLLYEVTQHKHGYMVIMAVFLGLVYDGYFLGIYGIASLLLPLIALFLYNIQTVVFTNRWTRLFSIIIIVTAFEVLSLVIAAIFGLTHLNFLDFIVYQLSATLLVNIVFATLLQFPLERLYKLRVGNISYKTK